MVAPPAAPIQAPPAPAPAVAVPSLPAVKRENGVSNEERNQGAKRVKREKPAAGSENKPILVSDVSSACSAAWGGLII